MIKQTLAAAMLMLASGCQNESASPTSSRTDKKPAEKSSSSWCGLDVAKAESLANKGDVPAMRNLRGYEFDCKPDDYSGLIKWGGLAAVNGTNDDEKEYLRILMMIRFSKANETEWATPLCNGFDADRREALAE